MATPIQFTDLNIVNQALTAMGEVVLQNLQTDQSVSAIIMREHYEAVSEAAQTKTAWRFNTTKVALNKLSAEPLNRWSTAWQLPVDLLKVLFVWPGASYEIQGQRLYNNDSSEVILDYQRKIEEAFWAAWFTRYVRSRLLLVTVKGITGDAAGQDMKDEEKAAEADALFEDAQQQPNQTMLPNDFIDVRA